jgi:Mg2+/citrate symporter
MLGEEVSSPLKNISNSIVASVTAVGMLLVFAAYFFAIKLGSGIYSVSGSYLASIAARAGPLFGALFSELTINPNDR